MNQEYLNFLASKAVRAKERGLSSVPALASHLFPFQAHCVDFNLRTGCGGLFLDTGLGKTECQLEWCQKAIEATNARALILTPLAVAGQTKRRADRWGYEARVIREQSDAKPGINICNYDRLDKLDPSAFGVISLDEASILKSFTGKTTRALIEAFKGARFKLCATATPAPNDHMELGNYAEFLEIMAANEMLSRFFINDTSTASQQWRLKGHAQSAFYDWMASWARMGEKPSDFGDKDDGFILPPFAVVRHRARDSAITRELQDMFGAPKMSATNIFEVKRDTRKARVERALEVIFGDGLWTKTGESALTNDGESVTPATQNIVSTASVPQSRILRSGENIIDCIAGSGTGKTATASPQDEERGQIESTQKTKSSEKKQKRTQGGAPRNKGKTEDLSRPTEFRQNNLTQCLPPKVADAPFVGALQVKEKTDSAYPSITAMSQERSEEFFARNVTGASGNSVTIRTVCDGRPITSKGIEDWWVIWCDTNDEQDEITRECGDLSVSIYGHQSGDTKEELHDIWLRGERKILITKISIMGYGMDWSHCRNMLFLGRSFSYENWYQAVRRCWRFGQKRDVVVHLIVAEGESEIGRVIDRKAVDHGTMKAAMQAAMRRANGAASIVKSPYIPTHKAKGASWISAA